MIISLALNSVLISLVAAAPRYYTGNRGFDACAPQGTPMFGHKWCLFQRHQAEIGSICWFSCREGYHLRGTAITQCIMDPVNGVPTYNDTSGHCQPNAPKLREGKNGPFLLHSYDPSTFVIHVDASKEVTLKSYYYLAFFVQSPGLNGVKNTVSFRVQGSETRYITENESRVFADSVAFDDKIARDRATFRINQDRFYEGYSTFESYSKRDHFIVHKSRKIQLSKIESEEDHVLASFIWTPDI